MQKETIFNTDNSISIGTDIKTLRLLLNLTQNDFTKIMLCSRATISKVEQLQNFEDISDDFAFKLYYFTKKIIESSNKDFYIKCHASKINETISKILESRCKISDYLK